MIHNILKNRYDIFRLLLHAVYFERLTIKLLKKKKKNLNSTNSYRKQGSFSGVLLIRAQVAVRTLEPDRTGTLKSFP